ncbi:MAG: CRISPR-associated RAMP protein [bacterium]|nr:CRISPR-associated RAMP protein [bacterium]
MKEHQQYKHKIKITGTLTFETAFHIGSGKEGELATNMGVLIGADGAPILPGSTLKGNFRSFGERLVPYLGLSACLLDSDLSGVPCVSDEKIRKKVLKDIEGKEQEKKQELTEQEKWELFAQKTCDVCRLFGSPVQASRIFFSDGILDPGSWTRGLQIRDGVCIDRDTETARDQAKYDFEVVPPGASFAISIELENPDDSELALIAAALGEWPNGFRLGGFTSRGLGQVKFEQTSVEQVDYSEPEQLKLYLLKRQMTPTGHLLEDRLEDHLKKLSVQPQQGGIHA